MRVCTVHLGIVPNGVFVDHHQPDVGAGQHLPLNGYHRIIIARQTVLGGGLHVQHTDPPVLVELAAEPRSVLNRYPQADAPREKWPDGRVAKTSKEVGIFQKKLPPLGKE